MTIPATTSEYVTIDDLAHLPEDTSTRYELIGGELHVSTQPHRGHQYIATRMIIALGVWSEQTGNGHVYGAPGVIFSQVDAVAPDVVWISDAQLQVANHPDGKLHAAPELVVEVLSPGKQNEERDQQKKLKLYAQYGVQEYWIVDRLQRQVAIYRRGTAEQAGLALVQTLRAQETLTSPLLPGFACAVEKLFEPA